MILRRVITHVREQNWTAIVIDFVIVVTGVFIGIQSLQLERRVHLAPEVTSDPDITSGTQPIFISATELEWFTTIPEGSESKMVRVPTHRPPTHPGEMLLEEFLEPLGMTQTELAERIEVPFQRINSLVNVRRAMTPDTALRLSRVFGTTPAFWMNHQLRWDLYHAQREAKSHLRRIKPVPRKDLVATE